MASSGDLKIDADVFSRRMKKLQEHWKANKQTSYGGVNSIAIAVGASSEDLRYLKSISLHLWLFGYELPDTVILLTEKELHILTSSKKTGLLQPLSDRCLSDCGLTLVLHAKPKAEDGSAQINEIIQSIKDSDQEQPRLVGSIVKDAHTGNLFGLWTSTLTTTSSDITVVEISSAIADVLSTKETSEVLNVKKAAMLASKVLKDSVTPKIEEAIDDGRPVKHSKLAASTEEIIADPTKIQVKLKSENCDIAYPPVIQSGGKYDFRMGASSDDSTLHNGVIVVSVGTRYSSYCANVSRSYVINPTPKQAEEYQALLSAHEAVIASLVAGTILSSIPPVAVKALQAKGQGRLAELLPKSLGAGIGLELKEGQLSISAKSDLVIKPGMCFNVCLNLQGLENHDAKDLRGKTYAFQIADTVVVTEGGKAPEVATALCLRSWDKISYILNEEGDGDKGRKAVVIDASAAGPSRKALRSDDPTFKSAEQERREKQEALLRQKNEETLKRLTASNKGGPSSGPSGAAARAVSDVVAYRSIADIPPVRDLMIQVDSKNEAVLLPIYGIFVPFHITTIKNVTSTTDHDHAFMRVTFNLGGNYDPSLKFPNAAFLKELSFRSSDVRHATKIVQEIKVLRSSIQQRDKEKAERASLVSQEKLIQGKKVFKLPDLWIRPNFGGKGRKMPGTLEAHANGFRYSNPKNESINVMYRNIRHAFFQPAEKEMVTILHFHLINPIMIGNKKTKDIQFYTEVMDVVQTLGDSRRNAYDPDEIEEEQREREKRNKINGDFQQFVKRVQEVWEKDYSDLGLEFDIPFRELGFSGTPARSSVFIMPTVNCLVELTEMPFTVVSLQDVEIINLERVGFNLKNFDMAIVFKDFARDVMRIDSIPTKGLEMLKEWLTSVKIKYYESKLNLSWKPILKSIVEDPEGFVEQGGWDFLNMEGGSDGSDEGEQSDDYQPSGEDDDDEDEDDDTDDEDASVVDSDDDDDDDEEDEDEEEGKSWEELEEEAEMEDRRKADDSDDDDRKGGKRKGGAKQPAQTKKARR